MAPVSLRTRPVPSARFRAEGVRQIITTPHFQGSLTHDPAKRDARLAELDSGWELLRMWSAPMQSDPGRHSWWSEALRSCSMCQSGPERRAASPGRRPLCVGGIPGADAAAGECRTCAYVAPRRRLDSDRRAPRAVPQPRSAAGGPASVQACRRLSPGERRLALWRLRQDGRLHMPGPFSLWDGRTTSPATTTPLANPVGSFYGNPRRGRFFRAS